MLLGAFGVCACLALPLAFHIIIEINIQKKERKEDEEKEERGAPSRVDGVVPPRVEALYDYVGEEEDILSFVTGEIIAVTGMSVIDIYGVFIMCVIAQWGEYWWEGHIEYQPHRYGFFKANYVKSIDTAKLPNRVEALFDFGEDYDEENVLSFVKGDIIAVTGMSVIGINGVFIICV